MLRETSWSLIQLPWTDAGWGRVRGISGTADVFEVRPCKTVKIS